MADKKQIDLINRLSQTLADNFEMPTSYEEMVEVQSRCLLALTACLGRILLCARRDARFEMDTFATDEFCRMLGQINALRSQDDLEATETPSETTVH
jgi:hypothetical protein